MTASTQQPVIMQRFFSPKTVIGRFVAKQTLRTVVLWAVVSGIYTASKIIGLVDIYPTAQLRQKIAENYGNNIGIEFLLGSARHVTSSAGSIGAWNTLGVMTIIGAIWAIMMATKYFRGEEETGRWEMMLSGQTTAGRAACNVLAGLAFGLMLFFVILAAVFSLIGRSHGVDFGVRAACFFAVCTTAGVALFVALGALTSQLMPTRAQAARIAALIFGIAFFARGVADITAAHWLLNLSPLGWVENLQPLTHSQPLWLIPIGALILILVTLTVYLANKRDLGEAVFADKAQTTARPFLLDSPLGAAVRLNMVSSISWLIAFFLMSLLYGLLTKSAAQEFGESVHAKHVLSNLAHSSQAAGATAFLGVIFLLMMVVVMGYAANAMSAVRRDEAVGYVDNFLAGPVSRLRWIAGRIALVSAVVILAGLFSLLGTWLGVLASRQTGVSFGALVSASVNALVPAIFTIGVALFVFGIWPRLTSFAGYAVLAWSFLLEMVSSGLKLNHWLLDTSILNHIVFAPAANPDWKTDAVIVFTGVFVGAIGTLRFAKRDLQPD